MEWPYRRFIKAFDAFQRRLACEELRQRRVMHLSALYANTNLDGEDSKRPEIMISVENAYEELIAAAWNGTSIDDVSNAEFDSDFIKAGRRNMEVQLQPPMLPGEEVISGEAA